MTHEAELFKSSNNLDYQNLNMKDFNTFLVLSGIYNFSVDRYNFDLICIRNDDSSVVSYFWKGNHDRTGLNLWSKITNKDRIFLDKVISIDLLTYKINNSANIYASVKN